MSFHMQDMTSSLISDPKLSGGRKWKKQQMEDEKAGERRGAWFVSGVVWDSSRIRKRKL